VASLVVNDGQADSVPDPVSVTAAAGNLVPVASAGGDQGVPVGATVDLDGSGSMDGDGDALTYQWSLISVPGGSVAGLTGETTVGPSFVADLAGTYVASLVVNDGQADSLPDTVRVTAGEGAVDLLSDAFDRPDSPVVGEGWVEEEQAGATVSVAGGRLYFDHSSDTVLRALVKRSLAGVSAGTLRWSFDFDWARTGSEGTYGVHMQLGDAGQMSDSGLDDGIGVNLVWANIGGVHQSLGYRDGGVETALAVVSGPVHISVDADLDAGTYTVAVDGGAVRSGMPFDAEVPLDTVRFLTNNLNGQNFSGRAIDNVVLRR
jgi:hypothetical protein